MPLSNRSYMLVFVALPGGALLCRAIPVEAFSPLPFAEDGVVVEPRPVARPTVTVRVEPQPRRSLRKEREHRQLVALTKLLQETQRLQRQMQEARRLQLLIVLVAAVRRAGMVG